MQALLQDATFWTAVSFGLFILLVLWKARGVMAGFINGRIERIRGELREAEGLRKEAKKILTDLSEELDNSEKQSAEIIEHAKKEADILVKQSAAKTAEWLKRKEENAGQRIRQEEIQARQEIHNSVVERSVRVAEALLKSESKKISTTIFNEGLERLEKAKLN